MVLMTSIAVVAGMVPQLWSIDGMKVAMGAVMIGGMLASLLFTFTLTPALFFLMERVRHWKFKITK
jgi:HAE1 family hydrophobic/amphiphilic exporter-1